MLQALFRVKRNEKRAVNADVLASLQSMIACKFCTGQMVVDHYTEY